VKPDPRKGSNGVFDVTADEAVVYSKHREGRYPEAAEIIAALRKLGASKG